MKPGSKLITADEAQQLEEYQKLGPVKDIQEGLAAKTDLEQRVTKAANEKELQEICEATGLNYEVAKDFLSTERGQGLKIIAKKGKVMDGKKEIEKELPFIQMTTKDGNKEKVEDHLLSKFAEDRKFPDYLKTSLFQAPVKQSRMGAAANVSGAVQIPDLSQGGSGGKDDSKVVDVKKHSFNATAPTRRKPWSPEK